MKRASIYILSALLLICAILFWILRPDKTDHSPAYDILSEKAAIVCQIDKPVGLWKTLNNHPAWNRLKLNQSFYELSKTLYDLQEDIQAREQWFKLFANRPVYWAWVRIKEEYEYQALFPLRKAERGIAVRTLIKSFGTSTSRLTEVEKDGAEFFKVISGASAVYYRVFDGYLIISSNERLLRLDDDVNEPEFLQRLEQIEELQGSVKVLFNRPYVDQYIDDYFGFDLDEIHSSLFPYTHLTFSLDFPRGNTDVELHAALFRDTSIHLPAYKYLSTTEELSKREDYLNQGPQSIISFSLENPVDLVYELSDSKGMESALIRLEAVFDFLGEDLQAFLDICKGNFIIQDLGEEEMDNCILFFPENIKKFKDSLKKVFAALKNKTPLQFYELEYRGYEIRYLGLDGLLSLLFAQALKDVDRPFIMVGEDFIAFAKTTSALKSFADNLLESEKLNSSEIKWIEGPALLRFYSSLGGLWDKFESHKAKNEFRQGAWVPYSFERLSGTLSKAGDKQLIKASISFNESFSEEEFLRSRAVQAQVSPEVLLREDVEVTIPDNPSDRIEEDYYESGNLKFRVRIKKGKRHGLFRAYHPNEMLAIRGRYKNGKKKGQWSYFDEQGNLLSEEYH